MLRLRCIQEVAETGGEQNRKSSYSPGSPNNLRTGRDGVKANSRRAAANMACMKNIDALLELSQEKARELGHALVEHLVEYRARMGSLPVVKVESTAALRAAIWEDLPARGNDPLAVLQRIQKSVFSSTN